MGERICFYCGAPLVRGSYQNDHFPIPARSGGTVTVPACLPCHDMKDRLDFSQWPAEMVANIVADFPKLGRETRIFIAKTFAAASDIIDAKARSE